jgi:hypothetical protein
MLARRHHFVALPVGRVCLLAATIAMAFANLASAQAPLPTPQPPPPGAPAQAPLPAPANPPTFPPPELDRIVSPIALYPDPLLAQVLAAATFSDQIPDAARWADEHHYLTGTTLTDAVMSDQLPWDPSVQALLPFPSVLDMMASAMPWTQELGNAFLAQRSDVMDAVQRARHTAASYGYLQSNPQVRVTTGPYIEIAPVNPAYIVVPYYNPAVVFAAPRPGFHVTAAITFGYGVTIGAVWSSWGWGTTRFEWGTHTLIVAGAPWGRVWANRTVYVHPYAVRRYAVRIPEQHRAIPRTERERASQWTGQRPAEEHRR